MLRNTVWFFPLLLLFIFSIHSLRHSSRGSMAPVTPRFTPGLTSVPHLPSQVLILWWLIEHQHPSCLHITSTLVIGNLYSCLMLPCLHWDLQTRIKLAKIIIIATVCGEIKSVKKNFIWTNIFTSILTVVSILWICHW